MEIFLHHYPASPFSEKIRLLLGYLGLDWHSVIIPSIMPRPLLMPLSGGYRRTPVLQIGANVYCDTRIIAHALARYAGNTTLEAQGFPAQAVADWADTHLFRVAVAMNFSPDAVAAMMSRFPPEEAEAFRKDRAELTQGAPITTLSPRAAGAYLSDHLAQLDATVKHGFLFGNEPTVADFSVYHCLWFLRSNPVNAALLDGFGNIEAWLERMAAFGHAGVEESSGEAALAAAQAASPVLPEFAASGMPDIEPGRAVTVTPVDYGRIPVEGRLAAWSHDEVVIERESPDTGAVMVHFPSPGFEVQPV